MLCSEPGFVPGGLRERLLAPLLRLAARCAVKPVLSPQVPIARQRSRLRKVTRLLRPHAQVDVVAETMGGVAGEALRPRGQQAKASILYLHGGAYCIGSAAGYRALTSHLADASGMAVFAADYRLAPEHAFPAAIEDALAAFSALREKGPVAIAGDSAGAGLALATALAARQRNLAAPAALVLFSPWVDLTLATTKDKASEAMLSTAWLTACANHFLTGQDAALPLASPIFGDLAGLPPVLIQTSPGELLHEQALRLHDALAKASVDVRCETIAGRWHEFQLFAGMLPSAAAALRRAADFVARHATP